jgi:hypothetical protein
VVTVFLVEGPAPDIPAQPNAGGRMKELSSEELQWNMQAVGVAASALGEPVSAATRCEQVTTDMAAEAAGVGKVNRGMMKGMKAVSSKMMPSVGNMAKGLETGGLPKSFILAVTDRQIHALEDEHDGGKLTAGKVLKSWDREGFQAKISPDMANAAQGIPADRQLLVLFLPLEGDKNKYLAAASANMAAAGSAGMPQKFAIAKDAASQGVIDAIVTAGGAANIMINGVSVDQMMAQAAGNAAADPTAQLTRLADLHDRGVLSDDEFTSQKAKILAGG